MLIEKFISIYFFLCSYVRENARAAAIYSDQMEDKKIKCSELETEMTLLAKQLANLKTQREHFAKLVAVVCIICFRLNLTCLTSHFSFSNRAIKKRI